MLTNQEKFGLLRMLNIIANFKAEKSLFNHDYAAVEFQLFEKIQHALVNIVGCLTEDEIQIHAQSTVLTQVEEVLKTQHPLIWRFINLVYEGKITDVHFDLTSLKFKIGKTTYSSEKSYNQALKFFDDLTSLTEAQKTGKISNLVYGPIQIISHSGPGIRGYQVAFLMNNRRVFISRLALTDNEEPLKISAVDEAVKAMNDENYQLEDRGQLYEIINHMNEVGSLNFDSKANQLIYQNFRYQWIRQFDYETMTNSCYVIIFHLLELLNIYLERQPFLEEKYNIMINLKLIPEGLLELKTKELEGKPITNIHAIVDTPNYSRSTDINCLVSGTASPLLKFHRRMVLRLLIHKNEKFLAIFFPDQWELVQLAYVGKIEKVELISYDKGSKVPFELKMVVGKTNHVFPLSHWGDPRTFQRAVLVAKATPPRTSSSLVIQMEPPGSAKTPGLYFHEGEKEGIYEVENYDGQKMFAHQTQDGFWTLRGMGEINLKLVVDLPQDVIDPWSLALFQWSTIRDSKKAYFFVSKSRDKTDRGVQIYQTMVSHFLKDKQ